MRIVQRQLGWKEVGDDDDWEIYWTDTSVGIERIMKLTKTQVRVVSTAAVRFEARACVCLHAHP